MQPDSLDQPAVPASTRTRATDRRQKHAPPAALRFAWISGDHATCLGRYCRVCRGLRHCIWALEPLTPPAAAFRRWRRRADTHRRRRETRASRCFQRRRCSEKTLKYDTRWHCELLPNLQRQSDTLWSRRPHATPPAALVCLVVACSSPGGVPDTVSNVPSLGMQAPRYFCCRMARCVFAGRGEVCCRVT